MSSWHMVGDHGPEFMRVRDTSTPTDAPDVAIPAPEEVEVGAWMEDRPEEPKDDPLPEVDG